MNQKKSTIGDYPEHLNPFHEGSDKEKFWKSGKLKRSNSFGETLRNSFLFKSFRPKKKDKSPTFPVELRRQDQSYQDVSPQRRTLPPPPQPYRNEGPLLPRSRFSERVAHLNLSNENLSNGTLNRTSEIPRENPFEGEKVKELKVKKMRRRKKRAPLPPTGIKEDEDSYLNPSSEHNLSEWSLTSVCTDLSAYSESEHLEHMREDIDEIMNITKELEKLTDNTININSDLMEVTEDENISIDDNYNFISEIVHEIIDEQIYIRNDNSGNELHAEPRNQNSSSQVTSYDATSSRENLTFNELSINNNNNNNTNSINENLQTSQTNDVTQK